MKKVAYFCFIIVVGLAITFSSCTSHKKLVYLQDINNGTDTISYPNSQENYRIQTGDILLIKIMSVNKDVNELFNSFNDLTSTYYTNTELGTYLNGFSVNDSGYVLLPVVGFIKISGCNVNEAQNIIQKKIDEFLIDAYVKVKLINYRITLIGEVYSKGSHMFYKDKVTVLDALGVAGGLTDYANTKKVLVLRATKEGTLTYRIDLTDKNLLLSPHYYLLPNDVVYVEPMKNKAVRISIVEYSAIITTISATLTTLVLILNLLK